MTATVNDNRKACNIESGKESNTESNNAQSDSKTLMNDLAEAAYNDALAAAHL